jgi:hypothetical protein
VKAIKVAKAKLSKYYRKTTGSTGYYYTMATILNPAVKLTKFQVSKG